MAEALYRQSGTQAGAAGREAAPGPEAGPGPDGKAAGGAGQGEVIDAEVVDEGKK
jgi:hypothetical protein